MKPPIIMKKTEIWLNGPPFGTVAYLCLAIVRKNFESP